MHTIKTCACSSVGLERLVSAQKVVGSSPARHTNIIPTAALVGRNFCIVSAKFYISASSLSNTALSCTSTSAGTSSRF